MAYSVGSAVVRLLCGTRGQLCFRRAMVFSFPIHRSSSVTNCGSIRCFSSFLQRSQGELKMSMALKTCFVRQKMSRLNSHGGKVYRPPGRFSKNAPHKWKSVRAAKTRFKAVGGGQYKRWRANTNHRMVLKGHWRRKRLSRPTYLKKNQIKLINKMIGAKR